MMLFADVLDATQVQNLKDGGTPFLFIAVIWWVIKVGLPSVANAYREDMRSTREEFRAELAEFRKDLRSIADEHSRAVGEVVREIGSLSHNVERLGGEVADMKRAADRGPNRSASLPQL